MENRTKIKVISRTLIVAFLKLLRAVAIGVIIFSIWKFSLVKEIVRDFFATRHVYDEVSILAKHDFIQFEQYTKWILHESDIDIRLFFVKNTGNKTIEELAIEKVQALGIGGKSREERGLLLLYDFEGKKLRIEVGYALEEYFPDAFVGYLVHDHARDFFAISSPGDFVIGLNLLIRMLHYRIREEVLGNKFDPRVVEIIRHQGYLSGGAGISALIPPGGQYEISWQPAIAEKDRQEYSPQPTPKAAYEKYLEWLMAGKYDPRIELFTPRSQKYLKSLPMTKAYFHYWLIQEFGKKYEICTRKDAALLYFTNDPLVGPHFFRRTDKGWQMDMVAEVGNTRNLVGGVYSWDYCGRDDIYTRTFSDKLINIRNHIRIAGGDNRELSIRGSH